MLLIQLQKQVKKLRNIIHDLNHKPKDHLAKSNEKIEKADLLQAKETDLNLMIDENVSLHKNTKLSHLNILLKFLDKKHQRMNQ